MPHQIYVPVRIFRRSEEDVSNGIVRLVPPSLGFDPKSSLGTNFLRVPVGDVLVQNPGSKSYDDGLVLLRDVGDVSIGDYGLKELLAKKGLSGDPKARDFVSATVGGTGQYFAKVDLVDRQGDPLYSPQDPGSVWVRCFRVKGSVPEKATVRVTGCPSCYRSHEKPVTRVFQVPTEFVMPNPSPNAVEGECMVLLNRVWREHWGGIPKDGDYEIEHPKYRIQVLGQETQMPVWGCDILSPSGEENPLVGDTKWVRDSESCVWPPLGTKSKW